MTDAQNPTRKRSRAPAALTSGLALLSLILMGLQPAAAQVHPPVGDVDGPPETTPTLLGQPKATGLPAEIERRLTHERIDETFDAPVSAGAKEAARLAYAQGVFAPIWSREAAEKLLNANSTYRETGFDSGISDADLETWIDQRFSGDEAEQATGDLKLTSTWLALASKLSRGLSDEGAMVRSTETRPTRSDLVVALRKAGSDDPVKAMEEFIAAAPQYRKLKGALKRYRQHAENGGWKRIRDGENLLEPGMDDPRVPALRKRLEAEGFIDPKPFRWDHAMFIPLPEPAPNLYDDGLVQSLKKFQSAHGLIQDGILGPATLAALNESVESKISRIEQAMNHWRVFDPGERYIWVNIPSYRAEAWTGDRRDISMKTIVGKARTPSTAFSDAVEYIVVNPKWFLPIGLFKRQKLRKLRKDPAYAARHNYVIYDRASGAELDPYAIDWTERGVASQIQMVQTPGPHNALGQLKIIFPNPYSIYLHDTPNHDLFERDVRALSSGCIRLEDPAAMANWLTEGDEGVSTRVFNATLKSQERDRFYLSKPVPVHLTYLPAVVNPEGEIEFPADIYQNFKKPSLAKRVYADTIEDDKYNAYSSVEYSAGTGLKTEILQ